MLYIYRSGIYLSTTIFEGKTKGERPFHCHEKLQLRALAVIGLPPLRKRAIFLRFSREKNLALIMTTRYHVPVVTIDAGRGGNTREDRMMAIKEGMLRRAKVALADKRREYPADEICLTTTVSTVGDYLATLGYAERHYEDGELEGVSPYEWDAVIANLGNAALPAQKRLADLALALGVPTADDLPEGGGGR